MFFKNKQEQASEKIQQAHEYLKVRNLGEGLKLFYEASVLEPENANTFRMIGNLEQTMMNDTKAVEAYRKAIELNPNDAESLGRSAACYVELHRFDAAQAAIQAAFEIFQKQNQPVPPPYQAVAQGISLIKAKYDAETAFKQNPMTAVHIKNLPDAQAKMDEIRQKILVDMMAGMNQFEDLLKQYPNVPELYFLHGTTVQQLGYLDWAMRDLTTAICLDPQATEAYLQRAILWQIIGRSLDMVADMTTVLAYDSNNLDAYALRAEGYQMQGNVLNANADNEKLLAVDLSNHPNIVLLLKQADIFFQHKKFDAAINAYNQALARSDATKEIKAKVYFARGKVLNNLNRKQEAFDSALKAMELNPSIPDYCHLVGEIGKQMGRWQESAQGWEAYVAAVKAGGQGFLPLYVAENFLAEAKARL